MHSTESTSGDQHVDNAQILHRDSHYSGLLDASTLDNHWVSDFALINETR